MMTWTLGQQVWNGLVTGIAYSLFAIGLTLVFGMMRVINMAHGEIYMLGAMLLWTLTATGVNFFVAFGVSVVVVGILGLVFDRLAIRPLLTAHPLSVLMSTMAVSVVVMNGATILWNVDTRVVETPLGDGSFVAGGLALSHASIALSAVGLSVLIAFYFFSSRSLVGRMLRATAQDRIGASLVGVDVARAYGLTVAVAAALAAVAGGIIAPIWTASPVMGQDVLLKGFAIVIIGGMGNALGCVVSGLLLGLTEALFSQYVSMYYRDVYAFGALIVTCLLRPQGLFGRQ